MECEFPTVNSNPEEERKILEETRTIAVVGLSPDETKDSHQIAKYLKEKGYKIIPVYPKGETILGEKVYHSLEEIPEKVDMADVFVNAGRVPDVVEQALKRKDVKTIWMQLGIVNNEAAERAKAGGIKVVQSKCIKVEHRKIFGS